MNPYPRVDMTDTLSRKYLVDTFTWLPATSGLLGVVRFPEALFGIPNIADKIAQFRWIRSDVTVEIRINTSPLHIGSLVASWISHHKGDISDDVHTFNVYQQLQNNGYIMSASSLQSLTFDIPRSGPRLADEAHEVGDAPTGEIGSLFISILNPLRLATGGTPAGVTVSVFAAFKNPEVSGYGYTTPSPMHVARKLKQLKIKAAATKQSKNNGVQKEADKKAKGGVISGFLESAASFTPILMASPLAEFAPLTAAAGLLAPLVRSFGFSKPNDPSKTDRVRRDEFPDFPYGHGLSNARVLALHPDAMVGDTKSNFLKRHSIHDIIKVPGLVYAGSFTSSSAAEADLIAWGVGPGLCGVVSGYHFPTHLAYLSNMFRYWRGGIKYKVQFITGQFTTARVRISHFCSPDFPTAVEDYAGDIVSAVVDIRGDTSYEFTVPYLNPMPYTPTTEYYTVGASEYPLQSRPFYASSYIKITIINPAVVPDVGGDSTIYMNIFTAAANDFEFGHLVDAQILNPPAAKDAVKQSLAVAFSKNFDALVAANASLEAGFVCPEKYSSIEAIMKRPQYREAGAIDGTGVYVTLQGVTAAHSYDNYIGFFAKLFWYYRGAFRFHHFLGNGVTTAPWEGKVNQDDYITRFNDGANALTDLKQNVTMNVEIPWTSVSSCRLVLDSLSTIFDSDEDIPPQHSLSQNASVTWISVGEDFVFGQLLAPPRRSIPASLKKKQKEDKTPNLSVSSQ